MEFCDVFGGVFEVTWASLHKKYGIIREGFRPGVTQCVCNSCYVFSFCYFYKKYFYHQKKDVRADDVALGYSLLKVNSVSEMATGQYFGFPIVQEELYIVNDVGAKSQCFECRKNEGMIDSVKSLFEIHKDVVEVLLVLEVPLAQ